ncbi:membrane protein [Clostridium carboxidivorans P7]|uniref:Signal transduction histidine kinase regulating citrate/malate metabolism n=2 Tax=Clostridium TaxID=1485 RepID=C6PYH8_9CLOT|nr:sensor histidine kinase [Clostridium carboxidivorans]AKN29719.1 membrane protein [Clostridium carboxidivorans P7]EET85697.1 signal transduction histidine kinase regulating citrate/malate metabolism [Clostridium carboxidivorans P7]EFG89338.1 membrane protein, putative [Clostridium carboxidivorans P7]
MIMFNSAMDIFYILLFMIPCSMLRYYPFLDKLRIPLRNVVTIYGVFITLEAGVFAYIMNNGSINGIEIQIYRISWGIIFAVYSFIVIKEKFLKQFFFYLIVASYSSVIFGTANFLEAHIFEAFSEKHPYTITNAAAIIQIAFTFPIMFKLIIKRFKKFADSVETDIWKVIWLIPCMFYGMGFIFTVDLRTAESWKHIVTRYMLGTGSFTACYILLKTLKQLADNAALKERFRFIDQQLQMQVKQYRALTENIEQTRKARHDLRHHLLLVKRYLQENRKSELFEYLEEQRQTLPVNVEENVCENTAVNVLACYYIGLAKEKGINTDFKISISRDAGILDSDLSIIFGNCIENALEACERMKTGDRFIRVRAGMKMGELVIIVGNSFDGHAILNNGEYRSIKRNGDRGIGISSIQAVVKKYGGESNFEKSDGNLFKVSMVLKTKEEKIAL